MLGKDIKIALIGAGRVAQHYKKILTSSAVNGFEIIAVADTNKAAATSLAEYWDCKSYENAVTIFEHHNPDLTIVLTPSGLHFEHAKLALMAASNVLVEKPLTMVPHEARQLLELAKRKNLMLSVAFQNRMNPAITCLRKAIQNGRFGCIISANIRLRWCRYQDYYNDAWHGTWEHDGGVINQQAIHHIDALNWLVGPIASVCATSANRINILEAEDTMTAILKFESGALGTIEATTAARPIDFEASISIVGEKGLIVVGGIALNKIETWHFVDQTAEDERIPSLYSNEVPNGYGFGHGPLLQSIIDRLKIGDIKSPINLEKCVETSELVHSLYSSVELGKWVNTREKQVSLRLGKRQKI